MFTQYNEHEYSPSPPAKGRRRRGKSSGQISFDFAEVGDNSALGQTMTVNEVMKEFKLKSSKNIITACLLGKVKCRKADAELGERGGVWLIERQSATERWQK